MRHFNFIRLLLGVTLIVLFYGVLGCHNKFNANPTVISDTALLRNAILKSIIIPFEKVDTLILSELSRYVECGNMTKEETDILPNPFYTMLDQNPYITEIAKNNKCIVITSKPFFDSALNNIDYDSAIASIYANKIQMTIAAEISDNGSVIVHERYKLNELNKSSVKVFSFDNKSGWNYKLL